ncbi:hypothetical protein GF373_06520 [bacterium]|nr:hypothetical protein [bacterium]
MKKESRCPHHQCCRSTVSRRSFLHTGSILAGSMILGGELALNAAGEPSAPKFRAHGPATSYRPTIHAAFVRREEEYGMWWPGAVYDGKAAQKKYTREIQTTAKAIGADLVLREKPIYSEKEADAWIKQAKNQKADGFVVILLDRQEHSWPSATKAMDSGIPSIIFSPLGSSFTTNTIKVANKPNSLIYCSIDDFSQAAFGMKMLKAKAKMQRARCVVLRGNKRKSQKMADLGIDLQYIPASTFLDDYRSMETTKEMESMAKEYIQQAHDQREATYDDVVNGIKSYWVAQKILEREEGDAITMDCLGALGKVDISLPCIAWSRMNDDGIPAACEADHGAVASHILVHYLFDRPGFQQDPVADTTDDTLIGAHCSCATRLNGYDQPSEPFDIVHHHGNRDAVPRTIWKVGQRISCVDILPGNKERKSEMLISAGTVVENIDVPPAGGCVVSVKAKFDGGQEVLSFPGFHQLFFYGDYKEEMKDFCQLMDIKATIV